MATPSESVHEFGRIPLLEMGDALTDQTGFLQPAAGRILAGAGLSGGQVRHGALNRVTIVRRIALGQQVLRIVEKSRQH